MGVNAEYMGQLSHPSSTTAWVVLRSMRMQRSCAMTAQSLVDSMVEVKLQEEYTAATVWEAILFWIVWSTAECVVEVLHDTYLQLTSSTYRKLVWLPSSEAHIPVLVQLFAHKIICRLHSGYFLLLAAG